jgi:hypothetical protein
MLLALLQLMLVQHRTDQNYKAIDRNGVEQMMEHKNLFILMIIIWSFWKEKEALKMWLRTTVKMTWKMSNIWEYLTGCCINGSSSIYFVSGFKERC